MYVQGAVPRSVERIGSKNLPVGRYDEDVMGGDLRRDLGDPSGLDEREADIAGKAGHGRGLDPATPPAAGVRLRDDQPDLVLG